MNDTLSNSDPSPTSPGPAPAGQLPPIDPTAVHLAKEWKYEPSPLISVRFEPLGRFVFAGAQDSLIVRLNLATEAIDTLAGHESWVRALGFSPDGMHVWSGGYDGQLAQWEVAAEKPSPLKLFAAHQGWIRALAVSPNGQQVVTAGNDMLVKVWDASTAEPIYSLTGHDRHIHSLVFAPDSKTVYSGDLRGVIKIWDLASGAVAGTLEAVQLFTPNPGQGAEYGGVRSMALDIEHNQLICGGLYNGSNPFGAIQEPLIVVVDCGTGKTIRTHIGKDAPKAICWRVIRHPQGFLMGGCGGGAGGLVCFWHDTSETEFQRYALPNILKDMDLHPDGRQLVTAHHDHSLRLSLLVQKQ